MPKTVLTIDDQGDIRRLIRMTLEFQGYRVLEAFDASSGLNIARQEKPDLILLDVNMPGTNGIEACQMILSDSELSSMPVIFLSGNVTPEVKAQGQEAGAQVYLTKPFNPMHLLDMVESHAS